MFFILFMSVYTSNATKETFNIEILNFINIA